VVQDKMMAQSMLIMRGVNWSKTVPNRTIGTVCTLVRFGGKKP
jgi:hypothetical protein